MCRALLLVFLPLALYFRECASQKNVLVKLNETATIPLPASGNYRRYVQTANSDGEENVYRVCNGKNKKTCGFWENVMTKKKVPSGATTYNKNKKALIVKKMRESDFGTYMTGNKKTSVSVIKLIVKG